MSNQESEKRSHLLRIDGVSYGGDGVVSQQGRFIFVPHSLPGDLVEARVGEFRRGRAWAEVVRFEERSERHVEPDCPHYHACSGCSLRHISRQDERDWKLQEASSILSKYGPAFTGPMDWVGSDPRLGFRRRGRFDVTRLPDGRFSVGLRSTRLSRDIEDVRGCPAQIPSFVRLMAKVASYLEENPRPLQAVQIHVGQPTLVVLEGEPDAEWSRALAGVLQRDDDPCSVGWYYDGYHYNAGAEKCAKPSQVLELAGSLSIEVPFGTWTHTHASAAKAQAMWVKSALLMPEAGRVLDTCTGMGTLAAELLAAGYVLTCSDIDHLGLAAFTEVAQAKYGNERVTQRAGKVGKVTRKLRQEGKRFAQAVINPMRRPLKEELRDLPELGIQNIVYLGPSPVSAAKDMSFLALRGYVLQRAAVIDLHPATAQFMLGGVMTREKKGT